MENRESKPKNFKLGEDVGQASYYTFPGVFSKEKEGPDAALENALSI